MQPKFYEKRNDSNTGRDGKNQGICPLSGDIQKCIKDGAYHDMN